MCSIYNISGREAYKVAPKKAVIQLVLRLYSVWLELEKSAFFTDYLIARNLKAENRREYKQKATLNGFKVAKSRIWN